MKMKRPYVICHMTPSIDGKIVATNWPSLKIASAAYERIATTLDVDAWIVGRVSMAPYAGKSRVGRRIRQQRMPRRDFMADAKAKAYAIAIDPAGKLTWRSNAIDKDMALMLQWFERVGYSADIAGLEREFGRALTKLPNWARRHAQANGR